MSFRLLQLTDLHLFADRDHHLRGVPTSLCFEDVLAEITRRELAPDAVVISGDLAHDEIPETYQRLRSYLEGWVDRLWLLPGNHDLRDGIRAVFPEQFSRCDPLPDSIVFSVSMGSWQILGLDTHVPGEVPGEIDDSQFVWLKSELEAHTDRPTCLILHHPPASVNTPWLDRIALLNPLELEQLARNHPHVRLLVCGHVHQEFEGKFAETPFLTTPATSMQFAPRSQTPAYDPIPPGFRLLDFRDDGTWSTEVIRLPGLRFAPDRHGRE